jgi:hypothetical protein
MGRLVKWVFSLAFLAGLALAASWAAAFYRAGALIGTNTDAFPSRQVALAYRGVDRLPGKPIAWVFTYSPTKLPGVHVARIYVSPTATVIGTDPKDLPARIDAWAKAQVP